MMWEELGFRLNLYDFSQRKYGKRGYHFLAFVIGKYYSGLSVAQFLQRIAVCDLLIIHDAIFLLSRTQFRIQLRGVFADMIVFQCFMQTF